MYLIWCEECKLQGVGRTIKMSKRLSNYYSHIKQKRRTCSSVNQKKFRLWQFEGYWQVKLGTVHPHGLNDINELKEWFQKFRNRKRL